MRYETRLFYVTDSVPQNEELFETLEGARAYFNRMKETGEELPRIRVCMVKNAYTESNGAWNYDDEIDTFETIKVIEE